MICKVASQISNRRLCTFVACVGLLGVSCSRSPVLIVEVGGIPESAARLKAFVGLAGRPAKDLEPLQIPGGQGKATQTFALQLPESEIGDRSLRLAIGVGAEDQAGCILATGATSVEPGAELPNQVVLPLSAILPPECGGKRPLLSSVSPDRSLTMGGVQASIRGYGIEPGAKVFFGASAAPMVQWSSPVELLAMVPPKMDGIGRVSLKVQNPTGAETTRTDLFRYFAQQPDFTIGAYDLKGIDLRSFAVGNFDGNALPDLAGVGSGTIAGMAVHGVLIYNNSKFSMGSGNDITLYPLDKPPIAVTAGDLNGDGKIDLALVYDKSNQVSILYNQGEQGFWKTVGVELAKQDLSANRGQPFALLSADLNGDGRRDLVVANRDAKAIDIFLNVGAGAFAQRVSYPVDSPPSAIAAGDLTGDGHPDLAVLYQGDDGVDVLVNDGRATFKAENYIQTQFSGGPLHSPLVHDLDRDGRLDLAFVGESTGLHVWLNSDGKFRALTKLTEKTNGRALALSAGDFNGDESTDLAVLAADDATLPIFKLDAGKLVRFMRTFQVGKVSRSILVVDANQDGNLDMGVLSTDKIYVLANSSK